MGQHYLKKIQDTMTEGSTHSVKFTERDKDDFFNNLGQLYILKRTNAGQPYDRRQLLLIFTNMKCMKTTQEGKNQYGNGITKSGISMMFMANNDIRPHQEIPHEIMHGAGLPHSFKETTEKDKAKTHIFKQGSTDNYMDYNNEAKRKHLWHWQWDKLYKSRYAK
ncbi:hypothetical protein [Aquimarina sediminis]|uniref:hypothetical protein n=1 Tax=Aquimarina sediminis TaxID=2070536 RepID=UPI001F4DA8EE|nr:hypothetical protein [Aquimarina sediminis]